ncbi:MAG TPA: hypothetical protein G4O16_02095 [Dehalococcoidia bacterium]|nr:hypothetical protein [Dehalococcoidia bacterium]
MTYSDIPKLKDTLVSQNFVLNINGEEIYRGKFYSMVISASYSGVVILDALIKLDKTHNIIIIQNGYPWSDPYTEEDPRNNQKLFDYLDSKGLLKPGEKSLFE